MTLDCLVLNPLRNMSTIKDEEELYQSLKNLSIVYTIVWDNKCCQHHGWLWLHMEKKFLFTKLYRNSLNAFFSRIEKLHNTAIIDDRKKYVSTVPIPTGRPSPPPPFRKDHICMKYGQCAETNLKSIFLILAIFRFCLWSKFLEYFLPK